MSCCIPCPLSVRVFYFLNTTRPIPTAPIIASAPSGEARVVELLGHGIGNFTVDVWGITEFTGGELVPGMTLIASILPPPPAYNIPS
jgi:hypothetical protein